MQHCSLTTPNIVENYMLCPLAHPVACTLLRVVGTYTVQKPVKLLDPMQMDATLLADDSQYCWELLHPFTHSSKCQLWCYKGLHTAMFRRTLYAKAEGIIPWIWLFCTESKGHPSFSKESFWHKTHCFSQIWHNFVDTISFFIFFSLFAQLSTFILNIKMKNK